jgi:hypothetical protein
MSGIRPNKKSDDECVTKFFDSVNRKRNIIKLAMKRGLVVLIFCLAGSRVVAQDVLLECGQNSGNNFNGWLVDPYSVFDEILFEETGTTFYSAAGGNFSVSLTKKVDDLNDYQRLSMLFNFEPVKNCVLEHVVYSISEDGKKWRHLNLSRNNVALTVANDSLDIRFIRATATAEFGENGSLVCDYVKVEGLDPVTLTTVEEKTEEVVETEAFYIFNFEHTLNIETKIDTPYEVLITSITGHVVYRERVVGSNRIQLPEDLLGIYIVNVIYENTFQASKKVVFQ